MNASRPEQPGPDALKVTPIRLKMHAGVAPRISQQRVSKAQQLRQVLLHRAQRGRSHQ